MFCSQACCLNSSERRVLCEGFHIHSPFRVGKYLVSPLIRTTADGSFAASVSIRSGAGSMTLDRVMRFVPLFKTHAQAHRFAAQQALAWLGKPVLSFPQPSSTAE